MSIFYSHQEKPHLLSLCVCVCVCVCVRVRVRVRVRVKVCMSGVFCIGICKFIYM